jgi:DNA (cytosine-5)-methyltransferase 1
MEDTTTRSGMLWEVERILTECKQLGSLPICLLMENVPQVHSQDNLKAWERWLNRLEELGYKNYFQDLIATDYGIPQTRNRCFMISILGDYSYTFPKPIPLKLKLKDMLEDNVEEKYYLSDKMKQYIFSENDKYKVNQNSLKLNRDIACSKTTREGWTRADTSDYIMEEKGCKQVIDLKYYNHEQSNRVYSPEHSSPTIRTKYDEAGAIKILEEELVGTYDYHQSNNYIGDRDRKHIGKQTSDTLLASGHHNTLLIKNATKQGYLEAEDGDGIDISGRMEYHRGTVQKGMTQTLSTMGGENNGVVLNDLRIRKLTPRECFRLMGVKDQDFDKVKVNQSDSSLYHLAGDSIVVQCLEAIFKELL